MPEPTKGTGVSREAAATGDDPVPDLTQSTMRTPELLRPPEALVTGIRRGARASALLVLKDYPHSEEADLVRKKVLEELNKVHVPEWVQHVLFGAADLRIQQAVADSAQRISKGDSYQGKWIEGELLVTYAVRTAAPFLDRAVQTIFKNPFPRELQAPPCPMFGIIKRAVVLVDGDDQSISDAAKNILKTAAQVGHIATRTVVAFRAVHLKDTSFQKDLFTGLLAKSAPQLRHERVFPEFGIAKTGDGSLGLELAADRTIKPWIRAELIDKLAKRAVESRTGDLKSRVSSLASKLLKESREFTRA